MLEALISELFPRYSEAFSDFSGFSSFLGRFFGHFIQVNQFKYVRRNYSKTDIKTPIEKVLEIISDLKEIVDDDKYFNDLEWCLEIISSNKLYDPIYDDANQEHDKDNEVLNWIANYSGNVRRKSQMKRNSASSVSSNESIQKKFAGIVKPNITIPEDV